MSSKKPKSSEDRIITNKRMIRLEQMILRGNTNQTQLAAAFGVSQPTIHKWMKEIEQGWRDRELENLDDKRRKRVYQLDNILSMALASFDRSKVSEEFTIASQTCPICKGSRREKDESGIVIDCRHCGANGVVDVETVKSKQTPGDAIFLKVALECIREAGRLEGIYPQKSGQRLTRATEEIKENGTIQRQVEELYLEAPNEGIIQAKAMLERLRECAEEKQAKRIETEVVEPEPEDDEESEEDDDDEV